MVESPAAVRPPVQMRRDAFDPVPELAEIRDSVGVQTVVNAFGLPAYLVTRHDDVKAMLSDHERFSNVRPPGFVAVPDGPDEDEQARSRAGIQFKRLFLSRRADSTVRF